MRTISALALGAVILAGGCAMNGNPAGSASDTASATASAALLDPSGGSKGRATVSQIAEGVRLSVDATGLTPGAHGLHIHTVGRCDPPDFTSAGPHWNPTGKMHGHDAPNGQHMGDLPNLIAGTDGSGRVEATIPGARLSGEAMPLLDGDGAAIVIHANADDYRTDPSGNSGGRIACGVFKTGA
jgi:Cu-Zn family superoxide dismutase